MKLIAVLVAGWLLAQSTYAQFYSPAVDFHDVAQRRFPVEAARLLAWLRNRDGAQITEITFQAATDAKGETAWSFTWREGGRVARRATVRYDERALRQGADWYRSVWQQLSQRDWAIPKGESTDLEAPFWEGAASAGLSRTSGLATALDWVAQTPKFDGRSAARLAGILVQAAQPAVEFNVSLDGTVLGRAAAWLCMAEGQAGTRAAAAWAPLLAVAGRGPESRAAWVAAKEPAEAQRAVWRSWDFIVRMPPAPEALSAMCKPENRLYSAPVFLSYNWTDEEYGQAFCRLAPKLYSVESRHLLIDYFNTVNQAHSPAWALDESLPARCLKQTLELIGHLERAPGEVKDVRELAAAVHDFDTEVNSLKTPSPELVKFLSLGYEHNIGALIPVGVVTTGDLLGYAWDAGVQEYRDLTGITFSTGRMDAAHKPLETWYSADIAGWKIFDETQSWQEHAPVPPMERCEFLSGRVVAGRLNRRPPEAWPKTPDAYLRRRWLLDAHRYLDFMLRHEGNAAQARTLIQRLIQEGNARSLGPLTWSASSTTNELPGQEGWLFTEMIEEMKLNSDLIAAVPSSVAGPLRLLKKKFAKGDAPLEFAREMEKLHWQCGLAVDTQDVFINYVRANALDSAFRFYDGWQSAVPNRTRFQSTLGGACFTLAVLQGDLKRAARVVRDMRGSFDRTAEITMALLDGKMDAAKAQIDDYIKDRNGQSDMYPLAAYQAMKEALDLIPALNDPTDARHEKALDAFPKIRQFILPEWVLLAKAHLSPDETRRFFADQDPSGERRLVLLALAGDRNGFEESYPAVVNPPDETRAQREMEEFSNPGLRDGGDRATLYAWLRNLLSKTPRIADDARLAPPGAQPLLPALKQIVEARRK